MLKHVDTPQLPLNMTRNHRDAKKENINVSFALKENTVQQINTWCTNSNVLRFQALNLWQEVDLQRLLHFLVFIWEWISDAVVSVSIMVWVQKIYPKSCFCCLFVFQRFVPTHKRTTSDYSSDSSSTGNSPETQHNVSDSWNCAMH